MQKDQFAFSPYLLQDRIAQDPTSALPLTLLKVSSSICRNISSLLGEIKGKPLSFIRIERRMGFQISGKKPAIFWVHSRCWMPPILNTCEQNKEITNYLQVLPQKGIQEQIAHTAEGLPCLLFSSFATKHVLVGFIKSCYLFCVNSQGPAVLLFIA